MALPYIFSFRGYFILFLEGSKNTASVPCPALSRAMTPPSTIFENHVSRVLFQTEWHFCCVFIFKNYNLDSQRLKFDYHFSPTTFCVIFEKVAWAFSAMKWAWRYLLHRDMEIVLGTGCEPAVIPGDSAITTCPVFNSP